MTSDDARDDQFGFSYDQRLCTGCKTCEMACKDYHDLGLNVSFRTVYEYAGGAWQQDQDGAWEQDVFAFYISMSCNHCSNPVCLRVCPVDAVIKGDFGFVTIDTEACTGCQICVLTCPYHAPRLDEASGCVQKCDGCFDRVEEGLAPICVEACPQHALAFGMYKEIDRPLLVERVGAIPDPSITQPNYAIDPCEVAIRATVEPDDLRNLQET